VCGATESLPFKANNLGGPLTAADLGITDARYGTTLALVRCTACDFVFADDLDVERLNVLYAELVDPAYSEDDAHRSLQMRRLCETVLAERPKAASWLDVGAATGLLVREALALGLSATGIEPSAALSLAARERGLDVREGTLPHATLAGRRFDVVSLIDVIEHVQAPVELCRQAARMLAPGGVLVVVTPDVSSVAARLMGTRWWHFRVAHVGYFSPRSFDEAAARAGLRVVSRSAARWYFPIDYLAERLARYVPIGFLIERARANAFSRRWLRRVIPLNLHDSDVYLLALGPGEIDS
jgi:2-polyprenyl-3-methyl-5-hydroxy-6-metoxy-1,4-benzoquinol methylase